MRYLRRVLQEACEPARVEGAVPAIHSVDDADRLHLRRVVALISFLPAPDLLCLVIVELSRAWMDNERQSIIVKPR